MPEADLWFLRTSPGHVGRPRMGFQGHSILIGSLNCLWGRSRGLSLDLRFVSAPWHPTDVATVTPVGCCTHRGYVAVHWVEVHIPVALLAESKFSVVALPADPFLALCIPMYPALDAMRTDVAIEGLGHFLYRRVFPDVVLQRAISCKPIFLAYLTDSLAASLRAGLPAGP